MVIRALTAALVLALAPGCALVYLEAEPGGDMVIGGDTCVTLGDDPDPGGPVTAFDPPSLCRHETFGNLMTDVAYSCSTLPGSDALTQARCVIPSIAPNVLSTDVICCWNAQP